LRLFSFGGYGLLALAALALAVFGAIECPPPNISIFPQKICFAASLRLTLSIYLSVDKELLQIVCFKPILLKNGKRYGKKLFSRVDRENLHRIRALLLCRFSLPSYEVLKK